MYVICPFMIWLYTAYLVISEQQLSFGSVRACIRPVDCHLMAYWCTTVLLSPWLFAYQTLIILCNELQIRQVCFLDGFFSYLAQMIASLRGCVMHNDFDLELYLRGHSAMTFWWTPTIWHILSCPIYSSYRSEWILSIFCTNDHNH